MKLEYVNVLSPFGMKGSVRNLSISHRSGESCPQLPTDAVGMVSILPLLPAHL